MPFYDYKCDVCHRNIEVTERFEAPETCNLNQCHGTLRRQWTTNINIGNLKRDRERG